MGYVASKSSWPWNSWETNQQLFENYHWPMTQSSAFQKSCFGSCVASTKEKHICLPTLWGARSKKDGNLFPCLNLFRLPLPTSGSERWGFGLKGGVRLVPLISLLGCWGDQWDHVYEVDWVECVHVVQWIMLVKGFFLKKKCLFSQFSQNHWQPV